jgi:hypothetical protein
MPPGCQHQTDRELMQPWTLLYVPQSFTMTRFRPVELNNLGVAPRRLVDQNQRVKLSNMSL